MCLEFLKRISSLSSFKRINAQTTKLCALSQACVRIFAKCCFFRAKREIVILQTCFCLLFDQTFFQLLHIPYQIDYRTLRFRENLVSIPIIAHVRYLDVALSVNCEQTFRRFQNMANRPIHVYRLTVCLICYSV